MKISYILASTDHGMLIVNRNDEHSNDRYGAYGMGYNLLETGSFFRSDTELLKAIVGLRKRRLAERRALAVVDCGANIGIHTIELARELAGAGTVIAIEAQRHVYYALCGNVAINNCFNVDARNVAVGGHDGVMRIPFIDYHRKSSFGSLELRRSASNENIGQPVDYDRGYEIPLVRIDALTAEPVDLIKIDVEGMEGEVIEGALGTLKASRPVLFIERIKVDFAAIAAQLVALGYEIIDLGPNVLAAHADDPDLPAIRELTAPQRV